ncbi:MAG: DUF2911 domain-containing protein [Bacteroidia bacterium]
MMKRTILSLMGLLSIGILVAQSSITLPQASQKASMMQTVGLTEVSITYSAPSVNDRPVWGNIVPMNQVWRAGANENTVISFSQAVQIEGADLAAGTYGLHMIPSENEWTLIFSNNSTSWGSYFYKESEDALRVKVSPTSTEHTELLQYSFSNPTNEQVELALAWEKLKVSFTITTNTDEIVFASATDELRSTASFSWMGPYQIANYCLQNDTHLEEALSWIDQSISTGWGAEANYTNLSTKAQILEKMDRTDDAKEAWALALDNATEFQRYQYGTNLIQQEKHEEAMEHFKASAELYPDTWLSHAGLGAAYRVNGELKTALKHYEKSFDSAPEQWKPGLEARINKVKESM